MNKQELLDKLNWLMDAYSSDGGFSSGVRTGLAIAIAEIEKLDEPEKVVEKEKQEELKRKVVIPQFVADWIKEIKDKNCAHALEILFDTASMPTEVYDWLKQDSKNWDIMARAWLNGYEVEKEKLYTVRLANGNCLYRFLSLGIDWMKGHSDYKNDPSCRLTQSEIESIDPILMQIAEEVD